MKTVLGRHLPSDKRRCIEQVVSTLVAFEKLELLILFGSYARGDYVDDPAGHDGDGRFPYHSDLDVCVIVKSPRQQRRIERSNQLREKLREASDIRVSLIVHTIGQFNRALENGEYFDVDVVKEGVLLHDAGTSQLSKPKNLTDEQRRAKAKEDYGFWTEQADDFLSFYESAIQKEKWRKAAFFLHQAAENYFTAACLVLSGYRPPGHDLVALESWCTQFDRTFNDTFSKAMSDHEYLFDLLNKSYVGARYKKSFDVTLMELEKMRVIIENVKAKVENLEKRRLG